MSESILTKFIQESRDLLEESANGFLAWEKNPGESQVLNQIFRTIHTMKGSSGLFDFPELTHLLHAAESLMTDVRDGRVDLTSGIVDLMLECMDLVSGWLDCMEEEQRFSPESIAHAASVEELLRRAVVSGVDGQAAGDEISWRHGEAADLDELIRETETCEGLIEHLRNSPKTLVLVHYLPDSHCFYSGEDPFFQARQTPDLLAIRVVTPAPWMDLEHLDVFACQLGFWILTSAHRKDIENHFRYVPQNVLCVEFSVDVLAGKTKTDSTGASAHEEQNLLVSFLQQQRLVLTQAEKAGTVASIADSVTSVVRNGMSFLGLTDLAAELNQALLAAKETGSGKALLEVIKTIEVLLKEDNGKTDEKSAAPVTPLSPTSSPASSFSSSQNGASETAGDASQHHRLIKVSQEKIDALLELAGELIVSKNALPYLVRRAEAISGARDLARDLKDFSQSMGRLAEDFQGAAMQLRLLPVSQVFDRFPRLVRDLSRRLNKQVSFETEGSDTEAEKTIVERLYDPLLHIIRNSLDHGLESPEVREAAGKPREGTIRVCARQEKGLLVITVSDDGRGIDAQVIKEKMIEKGLASREELEKLSDSQICDSIFLPGFSTKDEVSDVSGRGVGMDVVRTMAQSSNGSVQLQTVLGKGTDIVLQMPLTMAISHILLVSVAKELLGVPMDTVVETVKIRRSQIGHIKNREAITLRGRLIPIQHLRVLLQLGEDEAKDDEEEDDPQVAVLVVRVKGEDVGLVVDRFHEGIDTIVKPMDRALEKVRGFVGTSLLGDGRVLLVLNIGEVLHDADSV